MRFRYAMRKAETSEVAAIIWDVSCEHMDRLAAKPRRFGETIRGAALRLSCLGPPMACFEPKNPDYRNAAALLFEAQPAMRSLGISLVRLEPGEVELEMAYAAAFTQQNGFVHAGIITAGLDNACGVAAFSLMPPRADILTVEFKTNLLAPAKGERFLFRAHVVRPGRMLTVCEARALAEKGGEKTLVATMTGTLMAIMREASLSLARPIFSHSHPICEGPTAIVGMKGPPADDGSQ